MLIESNESETRPTLRGTRNMSSVEITLVCGNTAEKPMKNDQS